MLLQTYDSGVASVFHMPPMRLEEVTLNYGPFHTLVIFLRCEWMKQHDNRGNFTYVRNNVGFMVVNLCHRIP